MKKTTATIEQEIENVISTMPENEVEVEVQTEAETPEAPQPQPKEPVKLEITDDAQPMKRRRRKTRAAAPEPVEEPPLQILSGETLLELTNIIASRGAYLGLAFVVKKKNWELPSILNADVISLTEPEKKNLSKMADRAAEKMAASGDPVLVFLAGVLTIIGVKTAVTYKMIEEWNKEKSKS